MWYAAIPNGYTNKDSVFLNNYNTLKIIYHYWYFVQNNHEESFCCVLGDDPCYWVHYTNDNWQCL